MIFRAKNEGFTLVEILIVIGVIGVVAVLTIPNLLNKYQEKQTVEKLSSTYAKLIEVFQLMIEENGTIDTYGDTSETRGTKIKALLPKYMNGLRACNKYADCVSTDTGDYIYRNGQTGHLSSYESSSKYKAFQTLSGITFIIGNGSSCYQNKELNVTIEGGINYGTYYGACGNIYVDLNGKKRPNTSDKDLFLFKIVTDGIVPAGSKKEGVWTETFQEQCLITSKTRNLGRCTAWVLKNKNMEYLHCNDLNWTSKTKCN
jgi:prepilin-type N-terminal cleavage/methylation domain-containing protein